MVARDYDVFIAEIEALHARRWALIPVPPRSKNPNRAGWQLEHYESHHLRSAFPDIRNVGVLLGDPSSGLVDVDLDTPMARTLAEEFLPPTHLRSGRPGAPASHWFYVVGNVEKTIQFRDPSIARTDERSMLAELRSTGGQTLVPPSVHPSGERLVWEESGDPAQIAYDHLLKQVQLLAVVTLLVRYWPREGARHETAMALAGGLIRSGIDRDIATRIVGAVARAAGDPEVDDRIGTVAATCRTADEGRAFTGWTHLATIIDANVVRRVREWIGQTCERDEAEIASTAVAPRRTSSEHSPFKHNEASQATRIAELARDAGFQPFRDLDGQPYCLVPFDGHKETLPLKSEGLKLHLSRVYFNDSEKVPGAQMLTDARNMLEGEARFEGPRYPVAVRIALHGGSLYLDTGNDAWEVIAITSSGWQVVPADAAPVRFRRPNGLLALPTPDPSGAIDDLRPLLNLADEDDFLLLVGWTLSVLYPRGPQPVLQLLGEQGSAKSSAARLIRSLVDPNTLPLRAAPQEENDLLIAAMNSAVVAYDNLSSIQQWLSDAFCRLATGGGISKRQLYTDSDEILLNAKRPMLLTGITDIATTSDLLDRCITVTLPPIPSDQRRTERELAAAVEQAQPRILGALLNAAVIGLQQVDSLVLDRAPRLADFATWVEACAPGLGWEANHFVDVFIQNRQTADAIAIESTAVGPAILMFMETRDVWEGTASELLTALTEFVPEATTKESTWPKRANRISSIVRRLAPNLRQLGVDFRQQRASQGRRLIVLKRSNPPTVPGPLVERSRQTSEQAALQPVPAVDGESMCCDCGVPVPQHRYRCDICVEEGVRRNEALVNRESQQ